MNDAYPPSLLADVAWAFTGAAFASQADFDAELKAYQADIMGRASWDPSQRVLGAAKVLVQHEEELQDGVGGEAMLTADNDSGFTAGELMFKIHNAFVEGLNDVDHHFFEGLELVDVRLGVPVYVVSLGS
jgi:hypothetical protein